MKLILFEWKLIMRNKRLRHQFLVFMLFFPLMIYTQLLNHKTQANFLGVEIYILLIFTLPFSYASYAFGIQAAFIEKSLTTPLSMFDILQAKYRFFSISSSILFLLCLPCMFLGVKLTELVATLIFAAGFGGFGLFVSAIFSYKPFDIKASSFYNYQGTDAGSFWLPMAVMLLMLGIIAAPYLLFNETVTLIIMSVIGLIFIATHKIWLKFIAKKFYETKYKRLEKYKER